ncbi:rCG59419 [Rattus norvegicus]|nr:rCG59419 [Rattus norvegicus]
MLTRVLLLYGGKVRPQGEVALQGNTGQAVLPCVSCIGLLRSICHMTKQNKLLRFQPIVPMTIQCQSMGSSQLNK